MLKSRNICSIGSFIPIESEKLFPSKDNYLALMLLSATNSHLKSVRIFIKSLLTQHLLCCASAVSTVWLSTVGKRVTLKDIHNLGSKVR